MKPTSLGGCDRIVIRRNDNLTDMTPHVCKDTNRFPAALHFSNRDLESRLRIATSLESLIGT